MIKEGWEVCQTELNILLNYYAEPLTCNVHCICLTQAQCIQQYSNLYKHKDNFYLSWGVSPGFMFQRKAFGKGCIMMCYALWGLQIFTTFTSLKCPKVLFMHGSLIVPQGYSPGRDLSDLNVSLQRILSYYTYFYAANSFLSSNCWFTCLSPH